MFIVTLFFLCIDSIFLLHSTSTLFLEKCEFRFRVRHSWRCIFSFDSSQISLTFIVFSLCLSVALITTIIPKRGFPDERTPPIRVVPDDDDVLQMCGELEAQSGCHDSIFCFVFPNPLERCRIFVLSICFSFFIFVIFSLLSSFTGAAAISADETGELLRLLFGRCDLTGHLFG